MDQQNDHTSHEPAKKPGPPTQSDSRMPRKRFRIEKVEERIAPKKGSGSSNSGSGYTLSVGGY